MKRNESTHRKMIRPKGSKQSSGRQMKGNWRRHLSQGQGKHQETIILGDNMTRSLKQDIQRARHPTEPSGCKNPSQAKLFLIKTWGSIGARFKPWSSWISFDNQGAESFHKVLHGIFHLVDTGKRSNDFWQPCFTRMTSTKKGEIWRFEKKNENSNEKPRELKTRNTKPQEMPTTKTAPRWIWIRF